MWCCCASLGFWLCAPDPFVPTLECSTLASASDIIDHAVLQELEAEAQKLQVEIPAIGTKSERLTAELAKQEQVGTHAADSSPTGSVATLRSVKGSIQASGSENAHQVSYICAIPTLYACPH